MKHPILPGALLRRLCLVTALTLGAAGSLIAAGEHNHSEHFDHFELEATLEAPFLPTGAHDSRDFVLRFAHPVTPEQQAARWRLELRAPDGKLVQQWAGDTVLKDGAATAVAPWAGRVGDRKKLADGIYRVQLTAVAIPEGALPRLGSLAGKSVEALAETLDSEVFLQAWDIRVGNPPAPKMPHFLPLRTNAEAKLLAQGKSAPALNNLPYTIYYSNLHSQTNHSDGGGAIGNCTSSQPAQAGQFGPADAFAYARNHGLDVLLTSEHNHYFDGSSGTNTSASPTTARNLYQSGVAAASSFNAANPGFLALYGMEWGVISNGGHLNIINADELLAWESNSSGQLLGDTYTEKNNYGALYTLMKQRGWVGQFNHPETSSQFKVNGVDLGYSADGDEVMVLAEIMNTSAFSSNTTETESGRSNYENAFNRLLERGFHVAPASNQDNHCANWGSAYTNRTGVLLPAGAPLNRTTYVEALRARRVFATMDKQSQLVFTANGHLMGERFANSGPLTLTTNFANTAGRSVAQVQIFEGVPGRNGTVTLLSNQANTTVTPAAGEHFYYAKVTQDDGKVLWSAPVWVSQNTTGGDTTPPTVTASVSGSSGTIALSATASDNVGVTRVEFLVDGVLKGTDTTAPYQASLDSTTLANGSHTLTARAYDAADNAGTTTVTFNVSNPVTPVSLISNGGFENGMANWTATSGVIDNNNAQPARTGSWKAWLNGYGTANTDTLYQQATLPGTASTVTLSFWLKVVSDETTTTQPYDKLKVQVRNSAGTVLATLATYSNLNKGSSYVQRSFDLSAYKGQTIRVYFEGTEGSQVATSFLIDDVTLTAQ